MTDPRPDVAVHLDDRIRLMSALLAATDLPERSQSRDPHGTHAHARATRKRLAAFSSHPAVVLLQGLLDKNAPLEAMFTLVTRLSWPSLEANSLPRWSPKDWPALMRDFYLRADLGPWWLSENAAWEDATAQTSRVLATVKLKPFLEPFIGEVKEALVFSPNISYPTDQAIGVRHGHSLMCIAPPRRAWGDNPPWPFDEDAVHVYRAALTQYGRLLMAAYLSKYPDRVNEAAQMALPVGDQIKATYPTWQEQFSYLFVTGAVAIYLQDHVSQAEADAFVLMERKVNGMGLLPGVVSVLRRYLSEREAGRYESLIDFLPIFPRQLRVAKRIVSL